MNPNEILGQYQAILNQAAQQQQKIMWGVIAIQVVLLILAAWAIFMFYARLRDIADELRKLRMIHESSHGPDIKSLANLRAESAPTTDDARYMPKNERSNSGS
jgi:hypothetical protein